MNLPRSMHLPRWVLLSVILLAFGLRVAYLDASSLWSDEGNTWALIQRSFSQIAADAAIDIHPPGYYWLLKGWSMWSGTSAYAMRFFSAWLGVLLVAFVYGIGRLFDCCKQMDASRAWASLRFSWYGLLAAFVAAANPFLIFYSQEARMYMLLALAGTIFFYGLFRLIAIEQSLTHHNQLRISLLIILAAGIVGMWTHYSFPILLACAGIAYLCHWLWGEDKSRPAAPLLRFGAIYLLIALGFLPWASTAIRQILAWPQGGSDIDWLQGASLTAQTVLFGPLRNVNEPAWGWLVTATMLPLVGAIGLWMRWMRPSEKSSLLGLLLWFSAPIGMMFGLGLLSDAFLKFLLTASPAWCLLVAAAPWLGDPWFGAGGGNSATGAVAKSVVTGMDIALLLFASAAAYTALPGYYANPMARDNYAGMAEYMQYAETAAAQSSNGSKSGGALVILNAPGQQDVWSYYNPDLPVLALPQERPPSREATIRALEAMGSPSSVYGLFWATDESDPEGIVEGWLNQHGFKGLDVWQGNVRFVTYAFADQLACEPLNPPLLFGEVEGLSSIQLSQICRSRAVQAVSGEVFLVALHWQARQPIEKRLNVTLQLLDPRNQVIAQRDSEPAGGSRPTTEWIPIEAATSAADAVHENVVIDQHGLLIPPGTPPGPYRLIVALYDSTSGQRYFTADGDYAELGIVEVARPVEPPPLALLPMTHRNVNRFGNVTLLGAHISAKGFSHDPERSVAAGELAHVTLYWQASANANSALPADLQMTLMLGPQTISGPLAGGLYPTEKWQPGEIIRGEFDIPFDGTERRDSSTKWNQEFII